MGNQLKKEYDIEEEQSGSGGLGHQWRIFNARELKTKQSVSIFILDKKSLSKEIKKEEYYNLFKKSVERGNKLKHPNILKVYKPILESSNQLAFVTERVNGSLSNYFGNNMNCNTIFSDLLKTSIPSMSMNISSLKIGSSNKSSKDKNNDSSNSPDGNSGSNRYDTIGGGPSGYESPSNNSKTHARKKLSDIGIIVDSNGMIIENRLTKYEFSNLEIKTGISQICEAIKFIHNNAHMIHGFIDPCNIYITSSGNWKLFGFMFSQHISDNNENISLSRDDNGWDFTNNKRLPFLPTFTCLAPELLIENKINLKSDVFSIARIVYFLLRHINKLLRLEKDLIFLNCDEYQHYLNKLKEYLFNKNSYNSKEFLNKIPQSLIDGLTNALETNYVERCDLDTFLNCKYFCDMIVRVIRYLEKMLEKDEANKIKFLKRLPEV